MGQEPTGAMAPRPREARPAAESTESKPKPASESAQTRALLAQLRKTADARFRAFSDRSAGDAAVVRGAGVAEESPAMAELREIAARSRAAYQELTRQIRGLWREVPFVLDRGGRGEANPLAFADEVLVRVTTLEPFVGEASANELRQKLDRYHEMALKRMEADPVAPADAALDARFLALGDEIRKMESQFEYEAIQSSAVPSMLDGAPANVWRKLRDGLEHPRNRMEVAFAQCRAVGTEAAMARPEDILAAYLPAKAREAFHILRSEQIPAAFRADAERASNQLMNGCLEEAAASIAALRERLAGAGTDGEEAAWFLEPAAADVREAGKEEAARPEKITARAREFYEATLSDPTEAARHESIRRRIEREEAYRNGAILEVRPLYRKDGAPDVVTQSGSPAWVLVDHAGKQYRAVMKFDFADRWTRGGVPPGSGSLREAVGALAQVAMGNDRAPAAVSRTTEEYGRVTLMDHLPALSCATVDDWFRLPDGSPHPDLPMLATRERIIGRKDGATRNLIAYGGHLVPIDFGSDFASPAQNDATEYSSAAHYALDRMRVPAGDDVVAFLDGWEYSRGRSALADAAALISDDMAGFIESVDRNVAELRDALRKPPHRFPPYPDAAERKLGNRFLLQITQASREWQEQNEPRDKSTYV